MRKEIKEGLDRILEETSGINTTHAEQFGQYEKQMFQAIQEGRLDLVKKIRKNQQNEYGKVQNYLRYSENDCLDALINFACAVHIFFHIAITEGTPETKCVALFQTYIRYASKLKKKVEIDRLYEEALTDFTILCQKDIAGETTSPTIERVKSYLSAHLHEKITLASISKALGVSSSHLTHRFQMETGMRIHDYVLRERVEEACYYLKNMDWSIVNIGDYVGFSTPSHFSSVFKKYRGISPAAYRRNAKSDKKREEF